MPAYWFMYNMYALARNAAKYVDRDKRIEKIQYIEYDFLAPDSINEIFTALDTLRKLTAISNGYKDLSEKDLIAKGDELLNDDTNNIKNIDVDAIYFENSNRNVRLIKVKDAYRIYKELIVYYAANHLIKYLNDNNIRSVEELNKNIDRKAERLSWCNIGGQLIPQTSVNDFLKDIKSGAIGSWDEVHEYYKTNSDNYNKDVLQHAISSLYQLWDIKNLDTATLKEILNQALATKEWMVKNIFTSRAKDYQNEFRKMTYNNEEEMNEVVGKLDENIFINQQKEELEIFRKTVSKLNKEL
jgi:hypothetical protein